MRLRINKAMVAVLHDTVVAAASFVLSLYLRLGDEFSYAEFSIVSGTIIFTITSVIVFFFFRIYRRSWRYISTHDLVAITKATTLCVLIFLSIMFLYNRLDGIPRSALFINWFVLLAMLGAPRFLYRMVVEHRFSVDDKAIPEFRKIPVLLIGANNHAELFLRETVGNRYSEYRIVGILDNDISRKGQYIRGIRIFGSINTFSKTIERLRKTGNAPQKVIITPDLLSGEEMRNLLENIDDFGLTIARLPRLTDFKQTEDNKLELRKIMVEDLLGRPQKTLNRGAMRKLVEGKRVLVTGAGGSIGSELVRQIAGYEPMHLSLYDNSEHNLYLIDNELSEKFSDIQKTPIIGDVRNKEHLELVFKDKNPEIVFHAAALKHVPMSEINISETVLTNIIGTKNIADTCAENDVEKMVMISTDKAINPTNVMGASKRAAEIYVQAIGQSKKTKTSFITVRFGNVLGSTGSVVPLFERQLAAGGPLTVTHREMKRYFMTVREAVELVLEASTIEGHSRIFVLDMGEPVYIKDLAEQMIHLAGLKIGVDIDIEYTGLRAGEKLFEELFHGEESPTEYDSIFLANPREVSIKEVTKSIKKIHVAATSRKDEAIISALKDIVPEYERV